MEEKRCDNCKYFDLDDHEWPCIGCQNSVQPNTDQWRSLGFLWEPHYGEAVEHPAHYNHGKYECIEVMTENFGKEATQHFCLLNAFKYVWRSNYKNGIEDIKKAMFYLDYYLKLEGETHDD